MNTLKSPVVAVALVASVVVALDQVAKAIVRDQLTLCSAPPVRLCDHLSIAGPVGLLRTENGDGALGLIGGNAVGPLMIAVSGILVWWLARRSWTPALAVTVGLLLGGILANLMDRAAFGAVTDFIDIHLGPGDGRLVLNPADIGLALGGVALAVLLARRPPAADPLGGLDPGRAHQR